MTRPLRTGKSEGALDVLLAHAHDAQPPTYYLPPITSEDDQRLSPEGRLAFRFQHFGVCVG